MTLDTYISAPNTGLPNNQSFKHRTSECKKKLPYIQSAVLALVLP